MAVATLNPTANSGALDCYSAVDYPTARGGTGTVEVGGIADARIGQQFATPNYVCYQYLLEFDLTPLPGITITGATLTLYDRFSDALTAFTIEARARDYGASLEPADFVAGASLSALTLLASRTTAAMTDPGNWTLTDVAMVAFLVPGAKNRMIVDSSRQAGNNTPSGKEYFTSYFGGATNPPTLTITYTPSATGVDPAFQGGDFFS